MDIYSKFAYYSCYDVDKAMQGNLKGTITSDKSHSSNVTIAKKVSESFVMSSYEQNKKYKVKKHMINHSIDLI